MSDEAVGIATGIAEIVVDVPIAVDQRDIQSARKSQAGPSEGAMVSASIRRW
jgi:hypothetical protein